MDIIKWSIFEKLNNNKEKSAILFSDIKKSSELWRDYPDEMLKSLDKHHKMMDKIVNKYNGFIVKTIGDAFMCHFEKLSDSIKAAIEIQKDLKRNPIGVKHKLIRLRIGICYGDMIHKDLKIQNKILKDYFGNLVNTASRLESKISDVDGFAFAYLSDIKDDDEVKNLIKDFKVDVIKYKNEDIKKRERSSRLLTDEQIRYGSLDSLGGIDEFTAYKCKIK